MKYFKKLDLPNFDLMTDFNRLFSEGKLWWMPTMHQISINSSVGEENNIHKGIGSLALDWFNAKEKTDENGNKYLDVPEIDPKLRYKESDFTELCTPFKGTQFEEMYNLLKNNFNIGRVRIMKSSPNTCLSWHIDGQPRIHYPLKTQEGCYMVIENEVTHLEKNTWWATDTMHKHTAFNGSKEDRIHLVVNVLDNYENL